MRWLLTIASLVLFSLAVSGCRASLHVRGPKAPVVKIKTGHKHSHNCGHFRHKGKWHHSHGHIHKHGCGHKKKGGVWIWVK